MVKDLLNDERMLALIEESFKLRKGQHKKAKCPFCGGDVYMERSAYNGHHHIACYNGCFYIVE